MFQLLQKFAADTASQSYDYTVNTLPTTSTGDKVGNLILILVVMVLVLAFLAVVLVSMWKVYEKAGRPGWASIVPFYNVWMLSEIAGKPGWFGLVALLASVVPFVGGIVSLVMYIILSIEVAHRFGKSTLFGVVGLFIFSFVGYPMLAFGDSQYQAGDGAGAGANGAAQPLNQPYGPDAPSVVPIAQSDAAPQQPQIPTFAPSEPVAPVAPAEQANFEPNDGNNPQSPTVG